MTRVSVIVPVYNCKAYLDKCIDSILNQSLDEVELIIVNDGSTDNSLDVINKYASGHQGVIRVINQKNQGVSVARNNALDCATGKYVAFIDGDDYVDKNYLENLYNEAEANDSDMVFCGYRRVDASGNTIDCNEVRQLEGDESYVYKMMTICMRMFRRDFLNEHNNRFPVGVRGEDIPFNLKVDALGKNIRAVSYTGYNYVQHETSAMSNIQGLRNFKLPVKEIGEAVSYVKMTGCKNSYDFFELSVMRSFAMFVFQFGRRSSKADLYALCTDIIGILDANCPLCHKNLLLSLGALKEFPLSHRLAVKLFAILYKMKLLKKVAFILTRR